MEAKLMLVESNLTMLVKNKKESNLTMLVPIWEPNYEPVAITML
jgi:hypothetical protein